jgi:alpha-galactosidase
MLGTFGISAATQEWGAEDFDLVAEHVSLYRWRVRRLVHHGNQYRLTEQPPFDGQGEWAAMWYAAKDGMEGIFFAFRLARGKREHSFSLPGLDPTTSYEVQVMGGESGVATGADLANGLSITCPAPFTSQLVLIRAHDG